MKYLDVRLDIPRQVSSLPQVVVSTLPYICWQLAYNMHGEVWSVYRQK
jgi:hypothetical protein